MIGFPAGFEFQRDALEKPASKQLVEQALKEVLGYPLRCVFRIIAEMQASAALGQAGPSDPNLLNTVVDLFEGKILPGSG